ncbi:phosphoglycerate dehydrogenase [Thermotalea metallivorans]|uniref:Putative 2-hydroxyacid dehydrogenase n=1 Tax=Thermotalea metallivorans TaxID=520762 RepID=A0A140L0P4_9FIRM|nr:phosphoglycerate dehydrogenase [Thermotalea metallivorans]KXG74119.1 putative 2-hydroxyacid dehydrogenase [Thermotalea metallivorans]
MKALFTYDYGQEKMGLIKNLGYEILYVHERQVKIDEETKDAEILVCYNPFQSLDIRKMKNLKWIQLSSIGIDQVPIAYVKEAGIILTNNKGGYSIPMGEWIVMKILEMLKNSKGLYRLQQQKKWAIDTSLLELYGKTVGFIGTGSIATETAKRLQGFGVKILGLNTSGKGIPYFHGCFAMEDMEEMLKACDVVVLTIPYTEKTHHLINEKTIGWMKEGVYFVNVSRGSIVDEEALMKHLDSGKIKGAALDVFAEEPLPASHPLWDYENVIVTPHNSWISEMRNERRFETILENMKRYLKGETLLNVVDLHKGY